jgi:hypothetical protein
MSTKEDLFIKMVLSSWQSTQNAINKSIEGLSDEELNKPILPGRNTPAWIIGHLAAVNDGMFSILELGEKINPDYEKTFTHPDAGSKEPGIAEIRKYWQDTNARINEKMAALTPVQWFGKHARVSAEDFAKEPHRNKLNVVISRANHLSHHQGQLVLVAKK